MAFFKSLIIASVAAVAFAAPSGGQLNELPIPLKVEALIHYRRV
jgi:hypothetical protein